MLLIVIGTVVQDVVADAMSTEVVDRVDENGKPRPDAELRAELGMVQVLGRLALSIGILAVAGLSGWLAKILGRETVFLLSLIVPAISVTGVLLIRSEAGELRPIDWRVLGGGLAFGAVVLALALGGVPYSQELIFLISMAVICTMLVIVTRELDHQHAHGDLLHEPDHLRVSRISRGRRRLFLVDARRPEVRRSVLRHAAADLGDDRLCGAVAPEQAAHAIQRHQDAALDHDPRLHPLDPEYRALLSACTIGPSRTSASVRAGSPSSMPPPPRPSRSSAWCRC